MNQKNKNLCLGSVAVLSLVALGACGAGAHRHPDGCHSHPSMAYSCHDHRPSAAGGGNGGGSASVSGIDADGGVGAAASDGGGDVSVNIGGRDVITAEDDAELRINSPSNDVESHVDR